MLIGPKDDDHDVAGIKDPSIIEVDGTYHVFASTAQESGYSLVYLSFTDFEQADSAEFYYLADSDIGSGYRAAPQVFYFEPQGLWYLIFQNGNAAYSTNDDIGNPAGWSAPTDFYSETPSIIADRLGDDGNWVDMWVICDDSTCHLYSSGDNGDLYRSETALDSFPEGMDDTVIALEDSDKNKLFEAANVYRVADSDQYLLIVEAIGSGGRYFRSWTSTDLSADSWAALADTEDSPFAGASNVEFSSGDAWTESISHGEMVRSQVDQTLTISPCEMRYLYQGVDPSAGGDYNSLPWKLGLITQTNSAC